MATYVKSAWKITFDPAGDAVVLLDFDDRMLSEPQIVQSHNTEMVGFSRADFSAGFHFGNLTQTIIFSRLDTYSTLQGPADAILAHLVVTGALRSKTLKIEVNSGDTYQMINSVIESVAPLRSWDFKTNAGFQYTITGGELTDITPP